VLGGMGSISGAVVAAIGLTLMPEIFREFAEYRMIIYALALILVMILRPQGLFGIKELWETGPWQKMRSKLGGGSGKHPAPATKRDGGAS
jgi:branched-chain amino acid transport system permease protein